MTIDDVLNFLKGFVPGYSFLENLVAPPFGSDVNDYGQCRAICKASPDPASELACNNCVDKIFKGAILKLMPELAGNVAGVAFGAFLEIIKKYTVSWLEKKGLTTLASRVIPFLGWAFLIGDILNFISTLVMVKKCMDAASDAKAKYCPCP